MAPTLRASCDACNLAKVKCTKTRPCSRCTSFFPAEPAPANMVQARNIASNASTAFLCDLADGHLCISSILGMSDGSRRTSHRNLRLCRLLISRIIGLGICRLHLPHIHSRWTCLLLCSIMPCLAQLTRRSWGKSHFHSRRQHLGIRTSSISLQNRAFPPLFLRPPFLVRQDPRL